MLSNATIKAHLTVQWLGSWVQSRALRKGPKKRILGSAALLAAPLSWSPLLQTYLWLGSFSLGGVCRHIFDFSYLIMLLFGIFSVVTRMVTFQVSLKDALWHFWGSVISLGK